MCWYGDITFSVYDDWWDALFASPKNVPENLSASYKIKVWASGDLVLQWPLSLTSNVSLNLNHQQQQHFSKVTIYNNGTYDYFLR